MADNDLLVINQIFAQRKSALDPNSSDSAFWEFFTAEQILRDYSFDPDDIKSGIVGQESNKEKSGTDGGIDAMYIIANGKLVRDVEQAKSLSEHKGNIQLDIIIIQSKKEKGFDLSTLIRLNNTSESIFDIGKQPANFAEQYNVPLLEIIDCFREAHSAILTLQVNITVKYFIACCGDTVNIDRNILGKAAELEQKVRKLLSTIDTCKVVFLGGRDLISIYRKPRKTKFKLKCVSSMTDNKGGYVALVTLDEFFSLITENGQIREFLFESNVRDYEGDVQVNKQIRDTLEKPNKDIDFWWLNNGITIIAEQVGGHSPELVLHDPQIVNGLQTSQVIFDCLRQPPLSSGVVQQRHVVVRIIHSPIVEIQDKIIRATNSQTKIPPQYLWASGSRQRDIEEMFRANGLHYDRRRNSWRKSGRQLDAIIGPTELAQNVAAVLLQEPDHARARPSRYSKMPYHQKIFKANIPLRTYVVCSLLRKRAEVFLKKKEPDHTHRNNLLFYVMMALRPFLLVNDADGNSVKLKDVNIPAMEDKAFESALAIVLPIYKKHGANDKAAKGTEILADLKKALASLPPAATKVAVKKRTRRKST